MDQNITIPASTFLSLCNKIEDLERRIGALHGFAAGLHFVVDNDQVDGEHLENLIDIVADRLTSDIGAISEQLISVKRSF
ncbi:hypothetical protein FE848_15475 [Marinobacter sp. 1-3A]|uniref:hypothetical protein n=1 Tax=Marinobacter sp. 1-3A TaxID=2582920 RepID=UPI0019078E88|nr:hypothetical protein [Marinobacter sp. 1-3A]MBK1874626.1 hypothetical protein [Marinobacter sp. 1-3A]